MERSPQINSKDKDLNYNLDFIFRNAFGIPIILDSVPTNSTMKANSWGIYGTDIYIKFSNNVTLKLTGTNIP